MRSKHLALLCLTSFALACGSEIPPAVSDQSELNLPLGDVQGLTPDATNSWGAATTCKTLPSPIANLKDPVVVVSLDGLTLHLWDRQGTFDKVYPVGPGALNGDLSETPVGHFTSGPADSVGQSDNGKVVGSSPWAWWYRCKIWWTDPGTKGVTPVYAGLPLIRLSGPPTLAYAIHGPIDGYSNSEGGALRRGYVSHGCIRMQAHDILEVFVLLRGHSKVPITVQRQIERDANQKPVDLAQKWVGSECTQSSDCNFAGGLCHANDYGPSFCTQACTGSCPDRAGELPTACVADGAGKGMCVKQESTLNNNCRPYEGFKPAPGTARFGNTKPVDACVPGSIGFVGDSCLSNTDCSDGRTCERSPKSGPGFCTQACSAAAACPTDFGIPTACVANRCLIACDVQDACGEAVQTTCKVVGAATVCAP
jgi:hypothetical protein